MNEESSNAGNNAQATESTGLSKTVNDNINLYTGKVDNFVESVLGVIGNRPWDSWLNTANRYISKFLPLAIVLAGVLTCITGLVVIIKNDFPFSWAIRMLCFLIPVAFAMHLAPKTLALVRSFVENGEPEAMRPELMYVLKVVLGLGGLLLGLYLLLNFDAYLMRCAIVSIIIAVLMLICLGCPSIVGLKAGYPINCVEEVITLIMFPIRVMIALITPLTGIAVLGGLVYGVVQWFNDGAVAAMTFAGTAILPFLLPLVVYFAYLVVMLVLDLYKAIVSVPRKLDDLKGK